MDERLHGPKPVTHISHSIRGLFSAAVMLAALTVACADPAVAYRPFDGTDAAIAEPGVFELEIGAGGLRQDGTNSLIAPAAVLNLGLVRDWEAVLEGSGVTPFSPHRGRTALLGTGAFLKGVLREGVMQDKSGPSIATEFGALLPEVHGDDRKGASWAAIVSQRWGGLTTHLNAQVALTRDHHADYFVGSIF